MGREAPCKVEIEGKTLEGTALLESTELLFRGGGRRLRIPLDQVRSVRALSARGGALAVVWAGGEVTFQLGAEAPKWAQKIAHPPSRLDKLGIKPGLAVAAVGELPPDLLTELRGRGDLELRVGRPRGGEALIFLAVASAADLARLPALAQKIAPDGAIWVVRRKGKDAPVSEAESMAAGKTAGLVDTKVVGLSPTHTAERYVIPVARRPR